MFLTHTADAVTTLTLKHPPVNAISEEWVRAFDAKLDELGRGPRFTVLHIRSEQKVFCAGADLKEVRARMDAADGPDRMYAYVASIQRLYARIERLPQVTLAEIGGAAMGGGLELALACDLRIAAAGAKLSVDFVAIDLADSSSIRAAAAEVLKRYPRVDILVNGAGWGDIQPYMQNTPEFINRVIAINLAGPAHLTQALLPPMIAANGGKIINIASDAGRVGSGGETVYAGAKGGLIAFTKSLAREVARYSINVNCVCPGPTDTPMLATRSEKLREAFLKAIPFRRFAKPEEIADAVVFFASPQSAYVTGQVMSVSGGLTFAG